MSAETDMRLWGVDRSALGSGVGKLTSSIEELPSVFIQTRNSLNCKERLYYNYYITNQIYGVFMRNLLVLAGFL
jgi:hypothetical protein